MPVITASSISGLKANRSAWPLGLLLLLATSEMIFATSVFDFQLALPAWQNPVLYAHTLGLVAVLSVSLMAIVGWSRRTELWELYEAGRSSSLVWALALNLALFLTLIVTRYELSIRTADPGFLPLIYAGLLVATGSSLALIVAPPVAWMQFARGARTEIFIAVLGGSIALIAGRFAQDSWSTLAAITLYLSYWILALYEPSVGLIPDSNILTVAGFSVEISAPCSGYEGAGLIGIALALYVWIFRRDLRFPNAFLLIPLGMIVLWVLNAARIAALISVGAHLSPTIALGGFHSQAGWIAFLFVTLATIWISRRTSFFATTNISRLVVGKTAETLEGSALTMRYLAPFITVMGATIVASAFAPHDQWLYAIKVVTVAAIILAFRFTYMPLLSGASMFSIFAGGAIGVAWVASDPGRGEATSLGAWLEDLSAPLVVIWLGLRTIGSVVLVPIAEELAFRGFLHRALIAVRFEAVSFSQTSALALLGSSLAFGFMHQRWIDAAIAGLIYALLMVRSGRLADAVAAHMATNAVIMVWAISVGQWSLL